MSKSVTERMAEAAKYQKLAVKALFPEQMEEHIDVIGREIKAMLMEGVTEVFKKAGEKAGYGFTQKAETDKKQTDGTVKRIDIG